MIEPGELNWTALRGAVIAQGDQVLEPVARRHFAECALLAAKVGLRVEVTGPEQIRLSLLVRERAPPEQRRPTRNTAFSPVIRLATPDDVYKAATRIAWQSREAVTAEARAVYEEQVRAFIDATVNTEE